MLPGTCTCSRFEQPYRGLGDDDTDIVTPNRPLESELMNALYPGVDDAWR